MEIDLINKAIDFYSCSPTGQYDDEAVYALEYLKGENTRRLERFTLAAMQGLLSNPQFNKDIDDDKAISKMALQYAQAQIKALDEVK